MGYIPVRVGDLRHLMQLPVYMGTSENWEPEPPPQTLPLSEALPFFQNLGQQVNSLAGTQHNLKNTCFKVVSCDGFLYYILLVNMLCCDILVWKVMATKIIYRVTDN